MKKTARTLGAEKSGSHSRHARSRALTGRIVFDGTSSGTTTLSDAACGKASHLPTWCDLCQRSIADLMHL